ncbi:calcitonin receptor-like protein 1 [Aricia agestis]|uniref:calcitonin receptor-like protein 1 n=1 Tax=Aricia agestis TaxID=91739 RepID=UPI001C2036E5|nr:calcitonin receptor-like protein 1 [Aricia agestis]
MCILCEIVVLCIWIVCVQVEGQVVHELYHANAEVEVWLRESRATGTEVQCERPSIYTCEEPPDVASAFSTKLCNYRNVQYHEQVYKWVAGRGCLLYTPDFLYINGSNPINLNAACVYGDLFAPCLEIVKDDGTCGCFPFDPGFEEVARVVRDVTVSYAHGRWEKCFYEASDCCSHMAGYTALTSSLDEEEECSTTFDGWTCWHAAKAGTVASAVCSEFAYSNTGPTCHHYSTKECYNNGTWEVVTDYSTCSVTTRLLHRYWLYIGVLAASTAACIPAVFIFFFYKRLRVTRVALHRNLLIAIITRNILVIASRARIYVDELTSVEDTVMSTNGVWCRLLAVMERTAASTVFVCMLIEGIYLHRLIVVTFRTQLKVKWLYGLGAIIVVLPVTAWSIVMSMYNDHSCWIVYTIANIQWILDVPRIIILVVNAILFIDILRVLVTKIRNSENANQLSTAKATLFLMPLFGVQFIFTAVRPSTTNCVVEQVYYYIAYTVEGIQGFLVATLYCYVNKEVHSLIKATYKKTETAVVSRIRGSLSAAENNAGPDDRRLTYSTNLPANQDDKKDDIKPKYVAEIISIQASERLAEILDPLYETIDPGLINDDYNTLERSDLDGDSGYIPNRNPKTDDYYGFTNASSVSIGCRDWLKDSPYGGSEFTPGYIPCTNTDNHKNDISNYGEDNEVEYVDMEIRKVKNDDQDATHLDNVEETDLCPPQSDCDNMLDEIMQCIQTKEDVDLNPELLAPNRPDGDKIVFVDI